MCEMGRGFHGLVLNVADVVSRSEPHATYIARTGLLRQMYALLRLDIMSDQISCLFVFLNTDTDGLRPSATENPGNGPSNNLQKMRSSNNAGDGLDTPSDLSRKSSPDREPTGKEKARPPKRQTPGSGIMEADDRQVTTVFTV